MKELKVTGIMSGTSLDGVDLALCAFSEVDGRITYRILKAITVGYSDEWKSNLRSLETASAEELAFMHSTYGDYLGLLAKEFHEGEQVDFISSHGHTIFHQPHRRFTFQLGSGASIAAIAGVPVVCDFRSKDVALKGQGAPLVPIGDELLFSEYDFCLNLGGIANISYRSDKNRIAYDICPANLVLNELASEAGMSYDNKGYLASQGTLINELFTELNALSYYSTPSPKSLGRENVVELFLPLMQRYAHHSLSDRLFTFSLHIAKQLSHAASFGSSQRMLVTGGGAFNDHLISLIRTMCGCEVIVPEKKIVEFKEALIFAFLGILRWEGRVNTLGSVTGAISDSCGGCVYK